FIEHRPELGEHIRTCSTRPRVVFDETHRFNPEVQSGWLRVRIEMARTLNQHHLRFHLLSTRDAGLVEVNRCQSVRFTISEAGADCKRQNQLCKALGRLRTKLRDEQ
ncbi:hypothetical protein DFH29DRAFT_1019246, partial [Suillus ampliporus]